MRYVAIDFETSGLDSKVNAPVSIGVALMDDGTEIESFEIIIAPPMRDGRITRVYDVVALEVSGTTWKKIKGGAPAFQTCQTLMEWAVTHDARRLTVVALTPPLIFRFIRNCCSWLGHGTSKQGRSNHSLRRFWVRGS